MPDTDTEPKTRRRRIVTIEATPEAHALALILGETAEAFVAAAVADRVAALRARITPAVSGSAI